MSEPSISVQNISKVYHLGTINRRTLADEIQYGWLKLRGKDPVAHMGTVGAKANQRNPEFWALRDVSFDVKQGDIVGIIGRNGAGKSTLLKILARITEPTAGGAVLNGRLGSLLEVGTGFHPELTGRENVYMNGTILGMKRREIAERFDEIVEFSGVSKFIDTPVKRYSSGMYVRLAFAVAAHLNPEILLVDEVLAVGDLAFQRKCLGKMKEVASGGRTVLFVSHNMGAIQRLCDSTIWLSGGQLKMYDKTGEVHEQYMKSEDMSVPDLRSQINALPNDPDFEWVDIAVLQEKKPANQCVNGKAIDLFLTYRIKREVIGFHTSFQLSDSDDTILAESLSTGQEGAIRPYKPGVYRSQAVIPANLLNEGEYSLSIQASIHCVRKIGPKPIVFQIQVLRNGLVNKTYPDYKSPAKLLPYIEWNTETMEFEAPQHL